MKPENGPFHVVSQKKILDMLKKFYLVKITKYNFSACLKKFFETPHEMVQWPLISTPILQYTTIGYPH